MQFENPMTFVRALKGAPASVLWALIITQRMMTALELNEWTGYKGDNLTVALRLLVDLGWVVARSSRGPWGLAEGRQLPLMPGIDQLSAAARPDSDLIGVRGFVSSSSSIKFSLPTTEEEEEEGQESDLIGFASPEILKACDLHGIKEPARSQLARLDHVTAELIAGHVRQAREEGHNIGTAIYRIRYGWEVAAIYRKDASAQPARGVKSKIASLRNRTGDDEG